MNQDVKEQWLTALRSGDYPQTQGCLRDDNGYCCLGVLTDIAVKNKVIPEPDRYGDRFRYFDGEGSLLPFKVTKWAGLDSPNPAVRVHLEDRERRQCLSELNDEYMSFDEIADLIEDQL